MHSAGQNRGRERWGRVLLWLLVLPTQATYVMPTRQRLLKELVDLYEAPEGLFPEGFGPERFFDRAQRVRLRGLGQELPGKCHIGIREDSINLQLRNCPVSQLADMWNRLAPESALGPKERGVRLKAVGSRRHEELDLSFEIPSPSKEAGRIALGLLLAIEGLARENTD